MIPEVSLSTLLQKYHKYGYNRALEIRVPNHIGFCRPLLISSRIGSTFPLPSVSVLDLKRWLHWYTLGVYLDFNRMRSPGKSGPKRHEEGVRSLAGNLSLALPSRVLIALMFRDISTPELHNWVSSGLSLPLRP